MENAIRLALVVAFGVALVLVLSGAITVFVKAAATGEPPTFSPVPGLPDSPPGDKPEQTTVSVYQHRVSAYGSQLTAYDKEAINKLSAWKAARFEATTNRLAVLKVVIDSVLTPLLTALIAYALVRSGATILNNFAKRGAIAASEIDV